MGYGQSAITLVVKLAGSSWFWQALPRFHGLAQCLQRAWLLVYSINQA